MIIGLCVAFFIIMIDQLVKYWTINHIGLHQSLPGIPNVFDFFYIQNTGASWGIFSGQFKLFFIITLLVVGYLLYLLYKTTSKQKLSRIAYGLLIGGALGNFIDRLLNGYVIDMFRLLFINFPIFNVADIALTVGVLMLILLLILDKEQTNDTI
ncbi:signal peptidase II [Tuanshanicoccus lijuaniae]|uniref:signal peptidase II n=1 Tax=Aerococcaceae bacterium zg-1292 TaxID=2774330 RepID=UPI001BD8BA11|nr:signal peptidase II [Aerococcaceae bacterium zg-A91]MBS4457706.1 signal peptidase II [Aerococcaceae bacterium zg-BR33]